MCFFGASASSSGVMAPPLRVQVAAVRLALEGEVACAGRQEHEKIKERRSRPRLIGARTGLRSGPSVWANQRR